MFIILWEYQVKHQKQSQFETIYSPNGLWVDLFKKKKGYLGTELLRHESNLLRYLTIDRWGSKEDYEMFLSQYGKEYKALDARCEGLTESESLIGRWETI